MIRGLEDVGLICEEPRFNLRNVILCYLQTPVFERCDRDDLSNLPALLRHSGASMKDGKEFTSIDYTLIPCEVTSCVNFLG